jgi:uncharacterized membrane protein
MQVTDPMDARAVMPALFFTRLLSALCAPVFVALTGLSAHLYGARHSRQETSAFLLKRGLFLLFLELTFVGFAWVPKFPPQTVWLQVIWTIGLSMIALAGLIHLPRRVMMMLALVIVGGHNLLDGIRLAPGDAYYVPWAMLHQRGVFEFAGITFKTTYPVLPWIGVITLGYNLGAWFTGDLAPAQRQRRLTLLGMGMIGFFLLLRASNLYGDKPWFVVEGDTLRTVMSFVALTKYPPSLLFLLSTLGIGAVLLAYFERIEGGRVSSCFAVMGGAPMFFYLLHLYVLQVLYQGGLAIWGTNHGRFYGFDSLVWIWVWYGLLIVPLYFPTRWFAQFKRQHKDIAWLKYL